MAVSGAAGATPSAARSAVVATAPVAAAAAALLVLPLALPWALPGRAGRGIPAARAAVQAEVDQIVASLALTP